MLITTVHFQILLIFKTFSALDFCSHSVQTGFPGLKIRIFLLEKKIPDKNIALYIVYMIPDNKREVSQHFIYSGSLFLPYQHLVGAQYLP